MQDEAVGTNHYNKYIVKKITELRKPSSNSVIYTHKQLSTSGYKERSRQIAEIV